MLFQGWVVTDSNILKLLTVPDEETLVEVPPGLLNFLALDGLDSRTRNLSPPIVHVKENGNYIIQGRKVADADTLSQMDIPNHETCITLPKAAVAQLVEA
jgi:hypothetical protein